MTDNTHILDVIKGHPEEDDLDLDKGSKGLVVMLIVRVVSMAEIETLPLP
jgi:hypothetical protein